MPQDPNLYGQRPAKKQKKEIPLASSLTFTSQLTSLLSASASASASSTSKSTPTSTMTTTTTATTTTPAATYAPGRARPSKQKDDIFSVRAKRKDPPRPDNNDDDDRKGRRDRDKDRNRDRAKDKDAAARGLKLKTPLGTEDEKRDLLRARRNMEEKARLYAAMKRGDYVGSAGGHGASSSENAPLVDFDRKWAEKHPEADGDDGRPYDSSSGSDNETDDDDDDATRELVEYKDEFGRTRTGTRAEAQRQLARERRRRLGAEELAAMAARPNPHHPQHSDGLIVGDVIQTAAFEAGSSSAAAERMEELAARRDKSPTPPADAHFDARAEVRHKGVGFYQFATDDAARRGQQMDDLRARREETERVRAARDDEKARRRAELEERRRRIGRARAERRADSFLSGLAGEMGHVGGDGGDGDGSNGGGDAGKTGSQGAETSEKTPA